MAYLRRQILMQLILLLSASGLCLSQSDGPRFPASATNTLCPFAYSSSLSLAPAGNIFSSNNVYASASHCSCCDANTRCLEATNFSFAIPLTATITGIQVEIEKRMSAGGGIEDNGLRIIKGGSVTGTDHAAFGSVWTTSDTWYSYGGSADLWGTTWTPSDINASNFGVAFACISYACLASSATSFIDAIRITVFYTNTLHAPCTSLQGYRHNGTRVLEWNEHCGFPQAEFQVLAWNTLHESGEVIYTSAVAGEYDLPAGEMRSWFSLRSDFGGRTESSEMIYLPADDQTGNVWPNPAKPLSRIQSALFAEPDFMPLSWLDMQGGAWPVEIVPEGVAAPPADGVYLLRFRAGGVMHSVKVCVMR